MKREEGLLALLKEITLVILMLLELEFDTLEPADNGIPEVPGPQNCFSDQCDDQSPLILLHHVTSGIRLSRPFTILLHHNSIPP